MKTISNNVLSISVHEHGAELCSIRRVREDGTLGREYLWQADEKYWKRYSPVLFPFVGNVWQKKYRVDGQEYAMGQHGFARDMEFVPVETTEPMHLLYELCSSGQTLAKYPFAFRLEIGYTLRANEVEVLWRVTNTGDKPMPYQIGAHPAFFWPLLTDEEIAAGTEAQELRLQKDNLRGYFRFDTQADRLVSRMIGEGGCILADERREEMLQDGTLRLTTDTFDHDALVLEDGQVHRVTLCGEDAEPYLSLLFDAPLVGLWSQPKKNAPFVCIEPWYGRADGIGYAGELKQREHEQLLAPAQKAEYRYTIQIH